MSAPRSKTSVTRRDLLKLGTTAGVGAMLAPLAGAAPARSGIIDAENRRPCTTEWQLTFVRSQNFRSDHLGRPHGVDERVRTITANFLRRSGIQPGV